MADKHLAVWAERPVLGKRIEEREILKRVCVRPPYFNLEALRWDGDAFQAMATAEMPPFGERGPMAAAELGRHAAIVGLCRAALSQADDRRRYYLARRAACTYLAMSLPYGSPVEFEARLLVLDKRQAQASIGAFIAGERIAEFAVSYSVLNEATFERLFSQRRGSRDVATMTSPYTRLLHHAFERGPAWAEQRFTVPASACQGHFDGYPALPVAILMGQLSYLAGQLVGGQAQPYQVLEGHIEAADLCWAGEEIALRAERVAERGLEQTYLCTATVGGRDVGRMTLRLERLPVAAVLN